MARPRKTDLSSISDDSLVQEVLRRRAIHEDAIRRMDALMGRGAASSAALGHAPTGGVLMKRGPGRPPGSVNRSSTAPAKRASTQKRTAPVHCIYHWPSGCSNPHKGPRSGYYCDEHGGISKSDKKSSRAAYDANNDGHGRPGSGGSASAPAKSKGRANTKSAPKTNAARTVRAAKSKPSKRAPKAKAVPVQVEMVVDAPVEAQA